MAAPKYHILLQPRCANISSDLSELQVTVTLEVPNRRQHQLLFCLQPLGSYLPHPYTTSSVHATDNAGRLDISLETSETGTLNCMLGRDTAGDVVLTLKVTPRGATADDESEIYTELCCDQGGLIGPGHWFLPRIPYRELSTYVVDWDLSLAPPGTRASWSYAEGVAQSTKTGPNDMFLGAVFMVGPIVSFPVAQGTTTIDPASGDDDAAVPRVHWFGELPACFEPVKQYNADIFLYTRSVFQDPTAASKVYIRKVPKSYSAYNFTSCYIIQYSDQDRPRHAADVVHHMAHEMVHNWAYLGDEPDGYQNMWFIEGIAEFYALYLPVRAGVMGVEYFCQVLDEYLMTYYTSPLVHTPIKELPDNADGFRLPYERGFVYLLFLEAQLCHASTVSGNSSLRHNQLDAVVVSILKKHYAGEPTNSLVWRQALYPLLGKDTVDADFSAMMDGHVLRPRRDAQPILALAGKQVRLQVVEQERLEVGFDYRASLETGVIEGLVPGSRAEAAGLRNGDKILSRGSPGDCKADLGKEYRVTVQRGEETIEVVYWPRSFSKVSSYKTVVIDEQAAAVEMGVQDS